MKIIRKLLAGAAIIGLACSVAATAEGAASASTVPVMYAAHADGWYGYVKPGQVYFGNGGAPFMTQMTWKSWNGTSAWGTGKLWLIKPNCYPMYKCPYSARWVGVYMSVVRTHSGHRYFARMAVKFYYGGKWTWRVGWLGYAAPGATSPMWLFPAKPYPSL